MYREEEEKPEIINIVLLGNSVGKTEIIYKYVDYKFSFDLSSNYGSNYFSKNLIIDEKKYLLKIWDTSGSERFRPLGKIYLKCAKIAILVYDITDEKSFKDLEFWYNLIKNELKQDIILGLAGNKSDLIEQEQVPEKIGRECADNWNAVFSLLSAREDKVGLDIFFMKIVKKYIETKKNSETFESDEFCIKLEKSEAYCLSDCFGGRNNRNKKEIKIAFLGTNGVGKTNIISTICGNKINSKYKHTKKIVNKKTNIFLEDKTNIKINIIDTNGDDCKDSDIKKILEDCKILFLIFDFTNRKSFEELDTLIKKINNYKKDKKYINIIGNKSSLSEGEKGSVTNKEAEYFALMNSNNYECFYNGKIDNIQDLIKKSIIR